jgi:hypothetical protein
MTFYPSKEISSKLAVHAVQGSKDWNFGMISKICRSLKFGKREKICYRKNLIFRDLQNFAKNCFSEKKSLGTS